MNSAFPRRFRGIPFWRVLEFQFFFRNTRPPVTQSHLCSSVFGGTGSRLPWGWVGDEWLWRSKIIIVLIHWAFPRRFRGIAFWRVLEFIFSWETRAPATQTKRVVDRDLLTFVQKDRMRGPRPPRSIEWFKKLHVGNDCSWGSSQLPSESVSIVLAGFGFSSPPPQKTDQYYYYHHYY